MTERETATERQRREKEIKAAQSPDNNIGKTTKDREFRGRQKLFNYKNEEPRQYKYEDKTTNTMVKIKR